MTERTSTYGTITDTGLERLRRRIGIQKPPARGRLPHNVEVTADAVRHFAFGYGDDNPLYTDPAYATQTRWGGLIAPPTFIWTMGEREGPRELAPEIAELMKGDPLRGVGALQAQIDYEFYSPLTLGDRLYVRETLVGVVDKESSFTGRSAHTYVGKVGRTQEGRIPFYQRGMWIRNERKSSSEVKKPHSTPEPYPPERIEEITAAALETSRRGNDPRYWEDVEVGEELPTKVKGPLRLTDLIIWHLGFGMSFTPPIAFELSHRHRQKKPGMYTPNGLGVPDTVQRMHWDEEWANAIGMPARYDYGALRETFLAHLLTDWIGDDGWLWRLSAQHRHPNFVGDTTWVRGRVTGKAIEDGHHTATLEVWCENQRDEVTSPGSATVILPSREAGPITLPASLNRDPDEVLQGDIQRLAGGGAERRDG